MIYEVYTDAACRHTNNLFASAFIIRTDKKFVCYGAKPFRGKNIAVAESTAIGLAANRIFEHINLEKDDIVIFNTDRLDCVNLFVKAIDSSDRVRHKDSRVEWSLNEVRKLDQVCKVRIAKVRSHKSDVNCNKIADRLAKVSVRLGIVI